MAFPVDDPEAFKTLLGECLVPAAQRDHLLQSGCTTVSLFGHACPDADKSEGFLEFVSLIPENERFNSFSAQTATLRMAYGKCIALLAEAGRPSPEPGSGPASQTPAKPRLTVADVKTTREQFMKSYPAELLGPTMCPSISFLQILKDHIDQGAVGWVPWKSRTSEAVELEYLEKRRPRSDQQLLRNLSVDGESLTEEWPEAAVPMHGNPELVLSKAQQLLSTALAMLEAAHLLVLKRFHLRFLEIAVSKPSDPSLRSPNLQEILNADRSVWLAVASLQSDTKWTLNDVLNEIAFCRQDFHVSLQPKLVWRKDNKVETPKRPPHANQQQVSPKKAKQTHVKEASKPKWQDTWLRKLPSGRGICVRFHMTQCKSGDTCRYAHVCGEACGGLRWRSQGFGPHL